MATLTQPVDQSVGVKSVRLESVDIVRGVIMILMAIDHTRDYFGLAVSPTDLANTTVPLFFTRWITHFCAPTFFLLTGTGAYLSLRKKTKPELSRFLLSRGLWLIFLEITVVRCLGWQFNFDYHVTILNVLWALGWAMITLSALVFLPDVVIAIFGIGLIAAHNLLDSVNFSNGLWTILHSPGFLRGKPPHLILVAYVLIPWVGVTAVGYCLGRIYRWDTDRRRKFLLVTGIVLTIAFLVIRATNVYGDPQPWSAQRSSAFTLLSFLNTTKYPPSLLYLLMTLGPVLIFLWAVDGRTPTFLRPALVFGKVPMFYYLLHIPLIHLVALGECFVRYGQTHWMFESPGVEQFPITRPPGWGFSLPVVYLVWGFVVIALYPLCRRFADLKRGRSDAWLSYL